MGCPIIFIATVKLKFQFYTDTYLWTKHTKATISKGQEISGNRGSYRRSGVEKGENSEIDRQEYSHGCFFENIHTHSFISIYKLENQGKIKEERPFNMDDTRRQHIWCISSARHDTTNYFVNICISTDTTLQQPTTTKYSWARIEDPIVILIINKH